MLPPSAIALIFDLDGTLIDSTIDFHAVRHRLIDELQAAGLVDRPRDILVRLALPELVDLGTAAGQTLTDRMWSIIRQAELQGLARAAPAPRAREVLERLRTQGYHVALLTNNPREALQERLTTWELAPHLEVVATRDDVPALKPAPDGLRHVLTQFRTVHQAYMIGDAWIDGQAARDAGVRFIGVGSKRTTIEARGIPIWAWISDLQELLTMDLAS